MKSSHRVGFVLVTALALVTWLAMPAISQERGDRPSASTNRPSPRESRRQHAQATPTPAMQAREFRRLRVAGDELHENAAKLDELPWQESLEAAQAAAMAANKPIVWIQILGDFDGFT